MRSELTAPPIRSGPLTIRCYQAGDEAAILRLFHRVFGDEASARTLAAWRWQYDECPAGRQIVVGVDDSTGQIIAHYAAVPVRYSLAGEECIFAQAVDSMVDPHWRLAHPRVNAFLETARRYFELCPKDRDYHVCYGFPNDRAMAVGRRRLAYAPTFRPVPTLYWNLFEGQFTKQVHLDRVTGLRVDACESFGAFADELWRRVGHHYPLAAIRDARFLDWRFSRAPVRYACHRISDAATGEPRALFVLREGWRAPNILAISDLLLLPGDRDALYAVLTAAIDAAHTGGQTRVELWLPRRHESFRLARELGMKVESSLMTCVSRRFRPHPSFRWHLRNWYYTMADCDVL